MAELTVADKDERLRLALESSWQIEAIAGLINKELPDMAECVPLRVLVKRIDALNGVIMSALGDDENRATEEMTEVVRV